MFPITPINPPRRATLDTSLGGYDVPKDSWVFQHWGAMGERDDIWGDAGTFRPERFLNANEVRRFLRESFDVRRLGRFKSHLLEN